MGLAFNVITKLNEIDEYVRIYNKLAWNKKEEANITKDVTDSYK